MTISVVHTLTLGITLFGVLASAAGPVPCTFSCSFDGSLDPQISAGSAMAMARQEAFTTGRVGKALAVDAPSQAAAYLASHNLPKDRGSCEFWIQPRWEAGDQKRQGFVCDEIEGAKVGINTIWIWKIGSSLRFDVRDPEDHYICTSIAAWEKGSWHHVVANWDVGRGTSLYVDGEMKGERESTWISRAGLRFLVGRRKRSSEAAEACIDELRIYARPLTADEVALAYAGTLLIAPAPKPAHSPSVSAVISERREPKLLFHLPFDGTCTAAQAGGNGEPVLQEGVDFTPGVNGQAGVFVAGAALKFARPGNIRKEAGTISFWYRPLWTPAALADKMDREYWRCCFVEAPRPAERNGSNMTWLWFWGDRLRFDVSNLRDSYTTHNITGWGADRWHHIAATWNHRTGTQIYIDGEPRGVNRDGSSAVLPTSWTVFDTFPFFHIGSSGQGQSAEGWIDDFRIHDQDFSAEDVRAEFAAVFRLVAEFVKPGTPYVRVGKPATIDWQIRSRATRPHKGTVDWRLLGPDATVLGRGEGVRIDLGDGTQPAAMRLEFVPQKPGRHVIEVAWLAGDAERSAVLPFYAVPPEPTGARPIELDIELLETIDAAKPLPEERTAQVGDPRVVESDLGPYLEMETAQRSRYAVRLALPEADAPYVIEVDYPDDKPRTMEILAQTVAGNGGEYELQTGVYCGDEYPLSNRILTHRCVLWAKSKDMALIFMTAEKGRPAAFSAVRVFRLRGRLPNNLTTAAEPVNGSRRHVGVYYEDPALCYDFGGHDTMPHFEKTISRLMDYMEYSGQDLFMYPGVWYHGPLYPSRSQKLAMSRTHPDNFIDYILTRFADRGLSFIPTLNVHDLSTLTRYKCTEELMASNTMPGSPLMIFADGMPNMGGWHGTPPNYNPLHPDVRQAFLALFDEMLELYGGYPSLKGICLHLPRHVALWFGHEEAGYNDYCIDAFVEDTGIAIPVDRADASRVRKRYAWLKQNAWEDWLAWRCRAIHGFYREIADRITATRGDLKLIVNSYRPSIRDCWEDASYMEPGYVARMNREAGLDPALFRDDPGIVIQQTIYPADYRWCRSHKGGNQRERQRQRHFEAQSFAALSAAGTGWVNMHDRYWEDSVGRGESKTASPWLNETGWRVSTLNATPLQFMQHYLAALRFSDVQTFTKGGFLIGTHGVEAPLAEFARAFRALPAVPFADLASGPESDVVVRYHQGADGLYFYAANTGGEAAVASLQVKGDFAALVDLRSAGRIDVRNTGRLTIKLPPYSLKSYRAEGKRLVLTRE
ncbi:MAG: hypothetical protein HN742_27535 [Lentisphaerae bacterium]|jgi:hypothetical protein|nr:hypothetical protein [Lentisphaerota bacterium]MBT5607984.1 hypothetical protein [Lentisphaerota bacterium]MBT7057511.1 hypothetical protein [Lentisphaerota bacterium]MBT7845657.1 hypothetical protein [Lentisphaerota bacterium]